MESPDSDTEKEERDDSETETEGDDAIERGKGATALRAKRARLARLEDELRPI